MIWVVARQASWFPAAGAGRDLDAEIRARIDARLVHADPMGITGVLYTRELTDSAGPGGAYPIGADLWLLINV